MGKSQGLMAKFARIAMALGRRIKAEAEFDQHKFSSTLPSMNEINDFMKSNHCNSWMTSHTMRCNYQHQADCRVHARKKHR
jgi:hypothetical protein